MVGRLRCGTGIRWGAGIRTGIVACHFPRGRLAVSMSICRPVGRPDVRPAGGCDFGGGVLLRRSRFVGLLVGLLSGLRVVIGRWRRLLRSPCAPLSPGMVVFPARRARGLAALARRSGTVAVLMVCRSGTLLMACNVAAVGALWCGPGSGVLVDRAWRASPAGLLLWCCRGTMAGIGRARWLVRNRLAAGFGRLYRLLRQGLPPGAQKRGKRNQSTDQSQSTTVLHGTTHHTTSGVSGWKKPVAILHYPQRRHTLQRPAEDRTAITVVRRTMNVCRPLESSRGALSTIFGSPRVSLH
jgi:hypothetical protein